MFAKTGTKENYMKEFNYTDAGKQIGWNFSKMNYSVVRKTDFDYYKTVVGYITPKTVMLDIGSGSGEKTIRYYSLAKKVFVTDFEPEMLKKAKNNINKYYENSPKNKNKFSLKILDCNGPFDFEDGSFDLVVSRHCGANMKEVFRVLKKGGTFVSEDVSFDDCQELKDLYGRGQDYNAEPLYKKVMAECVEAGYEEIKLIRFEEVEYYKSPADLLFLLSNTPILGGFDEEKDMPLFEEYVKSHTTKKGIELKRKLYAFILKK